MGVLPMCLAMAFSGGVPVVEGWEFPSTQAGRKATEDVFFRAPSLEVFPLLMCVLYKFIVSMILAAVLLFHSGSQPALH